MGRFDKVISRETKKILYGIIKEGNFIMKKTKSEKNKHSLQNITPDYNRAYFDLSGYGGKSLHTD